MRLGIGETITNQSYLIETGVPPNTTTHSRFATAISSVLPTTDYGAWFAGYAGASAELELCSYWCRTVGEEPRIQPSVS